MDEFLTGSLMTASLIAPGSWQSRSWSGWHAHSDYSKFKRYSTDWHLDQAVRPSTTVRNFNAKSWIYAGHSLRMGRQEHSTLFISRRKSNNQPSFAKVE